MPTRHRLRHGRATDERWRRPAGRTGLWGAPRPSAGRDRRNRRARIAVTAFSATGWVSPDTPARPAARTVTEAYALDVVAVVWQRRARRVQPAPVDPNGYGSRRRPSRLYAAGRRQGHGHADRHVGAIVEHGEQVVAETLANVLGASPQAPRRPSMPPAAVLVPAATWNPSRSAPAKPTPPRSHHRAALREARFADVKNSEQIDGDAMQGGSKQQSLGARAKGARNRVVGRF